jgi:cyclopropane-fatty-acyl-phospholipid synthase
MDLTASARARRIVQRVFRGYPGGLAVRLWDGDTLNVGAGIPVFTLVIRDPALVREMVLHRDPLRLAEAYFQGRLDVEGDLYAALALKDHFQSLKLSLAERAMFLLTALSFSGAPAANCQTTPQSAQPRARRLWRAHSKAANRQAIAFHYDVSNTFYRLWLDEQMVYSCAYFESSDDSLDQAQRNKLDHICRKLRLKPGERLLDIGCGWGALIHWATKRYGAQAHGITLSRNQYDHARDIIRDEGLQDRATVELRDYRDLEGQACYDKIVSVGMFEHVGIENLPQYFSIARRLLKPGGLFLNHGITHDREGWGKTAGTRFINRYVFPDGELDTIGNVQRAMEQTDFEILDVEGLRRHYALTLRHWVERLEDRKAEAQRLVPESIYRIWRLYMAGCALQFDQGAIGVYQILAANRGGGPEPVPLTRRDLYI